MSNQINTNLTERAQELLEELDSHPSGIHRSIEAALKTGDLDDLRFQVTRAESFLSQEHFHNNNMLERGDEY